MDEMTKGIMIYVVFNLITALAMVFAVLNARAQRLRIFPRILPFIIVEALFAFAFVYWFITNSAS